MSLPRKTFIILLVVYTAVLFCTALVLREPMGQEHIHRELFWGFHSGSQALWSNLINIGAFVPVGLLVGLLAGEYRALKAAATGLFLSETFECLQLITLRGVFDVDDLFTNLTGDSMRKYSYLCQTRLETLTQVGGYRRNPQLGGLMAVLIIRLYTKTT